MGLEVATYLESLNGLNPVGGTDPKSEGDDHLRLIKNTLKNTFPGMIGAGKRTLVDAGAGIGPLWTDFRDSASPAAADILGGRSFTGRTTTAAEKEYAKYYASIIDATNGSEDGQFNVNCTVAGVDTLMGSFGAAGLLFPSTKGVSWTGGSTSAGAVATRTALGLDSHLEQVSATILVPAAGATYYICISFPFAGTFTRCSGYCQSGSGTVRFSGFGTPLTDMAVNSAAVVNTAVAWGFAVNHHCSVAILANSAMTQLAVSFGYTRATV